MSQWAAEPKAMLPPGEPRRSGRLVITGQVTQAPIPPVRFNAAKSGRSVLRDRNFDRRDRHSRSDLSLRS